MNILVSGVISFKLPTWSYYTLMFSIYKIHGEVHEVTTDMYTKFLRMKSNHSMSSH